MLDVDALRTAVRSRILWRRGVDLLTRDEQAALRSSVLTVLRAHDGEEVAVVFAFWREPGFVVPPAVLARRLQRRARLRWRLGLGRATCWQGAAGCHCLDVALEAPSVLRGGREVVLAEAGRLHAELVDDAGWREAVGRASRRWAVASAAPGPVLVESVVDVLVEPEVHEAEPEAPSTDEVPGARPAAPEPDPEPESRSGVRMVPGPKAFTHYSRRSQAERSIAQEIMDSEF